MGLDPKKLRAEADAHRERLDGPLWSEGEAAAGSSADAPSFARGIPAGHEGEPRFREEPPRVTAPSLPPLPPPEAELALPDTAEVMRRLDRHEALLRALATRLDTPAESTDWIAAALGDPRDFDRPDPSRITVCARVQPDLYADVQLLGKRLDLHSTAAALEAVLRLGLAAAGRLPTSKG